MDAVQRLRRKASASGAPAIQPRSKPSVPRRKATRTYIEIQPANTQVGICARNYNPVAVWGPAAGILPLPSHLLTRRSPPEPSLRRSAISFWSRGDGG